MAKKKKKRAKTEKAPVTPAKAQKILSDGMIRGKPLTEKQKKFFSLLAGGAKRIKKRR